MHVTWEGLMKALFTTIKLFTKQTSLKHVFIECLKVSTSRKKAAILACSDHKILS